MAVTTVRQWGRLVLAAVLGAGLTMAPAVDAAVVFCKRKKRVTAREDTCKPKEVPVQVGGTSIDPAGLGTVPTATQAEQAANAETAASATDAEALGGIPAADYQRRARWALVASDGAVVSQSGGITVVASATGVKILDLGEDVRGRALLATLKGGVLANGMIRATICGGNTPEQTDCNVVGAANAPNEIGVATQDPAGAAADRSFYVAVLP